MEEAPNDNSEEVDFDGGETEVAVAPNPAMNGSAPHTNGNGNQAGQINKVVTERYTVPVNSNNLMGRVNNRPPYAAPQKKEVVDREFLDTFNLKPEAEDYRLSCTRTQPCINSDGEMVPTGADSKLIAPIMTYDELQQTIIDAWGGGVYRVTFVEPSGRRAENINRAIIISIPTTQYPPKREKGEKIEISRISKNGIAPTIAITEEDRQWKEEMEEDKRQAKRDLLEQQKMEREYKKIKREKEIEMMRRELMAPKDDGKATEIILLEKRLDEEKHAREEAVRKSDEERRERDRRYEDDKKEAQRRADEDRRMFMDGLTKVTEKLTEVANRPLPPPPPKDDTMAVMLAAMAPVLTALVSRPTPLPPDNKEIFLELNKAQSESTKQITQMTTAMLSAPKADPNAPIMGLIMKMMEKDATGKDALLGNLLTAIVSNKGDTLTPEIMMNLIQMGEKRADKILEMTQGINSGNQANEEGGVDYDPALGFLGNAGKALFGSLKALMDSAATNPQLLELAAKLIGSRNPTDQQLAQVAYQMEHNGVPPALAYQQPQRQLPEYAPTNQQAIPYPPQPPIYAQQVQQPAPRTMPPPMAQPPNVAAQQQQVVASELEREASGLPSNGDPEPDRVMSTEELAEMGLRDAVTNTVEIMVTEGVNKPTVRTWPEDASQYWPKHFIQSIVECSDNPSRLRMIGSKCEIEVAKKLNAIWQANFDEQRIFWEQMVRFVEMSKAVPVQVQVAPPIQAPPVQPPVPAPVQP